jgi:hypothetical protein
MLENINNYTAKCVEYETKVTTLTLQLEKEREMSHLSRGVLGTHCHSSTYSLT